MKLEELIQKLEEANPWSLEKVGPIFDSKFTEIPFPYPASMGKPTFVSYEAKSITFEKGLIVNKVELRLSVPENELIRLIVNLSEDSSCITLNRIENTFPSIKPSPFGGPRGRSLDEEMNFWAERPWGHISFGFKERRKDCLSSIIFIPTKWQ